MAVEKIPTTVGIVASAVAATAIPETVLTVFLFATTVIIVSGAFTATCFVVSMIFLIISPPVGGKYPGGRAVGVAVETGGSWVGVGDTENDGVGVTV